MTERAKKIYRAWEDKWVESNKFPNHEELSLAAAIREIANCFEWDSYGLAELCADDFNEIADELEELK
jgi:O-succinylbenzoate synthase